MHKNIVLDIVDFFYEDDWIYFIARRIPFIWRYSNVKGSAAVLVDFSKYVNIEGAFVRLIKVKQKIYCIPCHADNIYCYNLEKAHFYSLDIPKMLFDRMPKRKIIEPVNLNGYLYCVCRSPHLVIEINTESDTYEIYEYQGIGQEHNFFAIKNIEGVIEYPFLYNRLIGFDTKNKKFSIKTLYEQEIENCPEEKYIYNFEYDSMGSIWWCNFRGEVYHDANSETCQIEMPDGFNGQYHDAIGRERPGINGMLFLNNNLCFVLASDYRILIYDIFKKVFIWSRNPGEECFRNQEVYFHYNVLGENELLLYSQDTKIFYTWNIEKGFTDQFVISLSADILAQNRVLQSYININIEAETNEVDLQFYMEYVKYLEDREEALIKTKETTGGKIYLNGI